VELKSKFRTQARKGFVFTTDAFLAAAILITGLTLLGMYTVQEHPNESIQYLSTDLLSVLSELKMSDLPNEVYTDSYYDILPEYTNPNNSIIIQIGTYWALNTTEGNELAQNLTAYFLTDLLANYTGMEINLSSEDNVTKKVVSTIIYQKNGTKNENLIAADRMVTGVLQGAALTGSTSSAYLRKITDKRTKSFSYFGGFVGQGNITTFIDVPSDVTSEDITAMALEADLEGNFSLLINEALCMSMVPTTANMTPDYWDTTVCNASIVSGRNNISLVFENQNFAYVAGGYFRIDYKTDEVQPSFSLTNKTQYLPEIKGVVNLFDSFYIPGNLTSLKVYLHYVANHSIEAFNNTFYMTIGNTTVYVDTDSTTEQSITLDNLLLQEKLNYSELYLQTVPIRMGFENISYQSQLIGNSKVMLVTDVSGSMNWKMIGSDWDNGVKRNCTNSNLNDSDTQRLSVAKCLDRQFAEDVLNISGNQLGLISYEDATESSNTVSPTTNITRIHNTIGLGNPESGYIAEGGTCICCGINSAVTQLTNGSSRTTLISNGSSWKYNNDSFDSAPSDDPAGNAWYELDYDDSIWNSGNSVLGHYAGSGVTVNTELGTGNLSTPLDYAKLWENWNDTAGAPNDFSGGVINSTGNTFGISGANDGWDWAGGSSAFGYDNEVDFHGAAGGRLSMDFQDSASNDCNDEDCSGAYGISVNITPEIVTYLSNGGSALLSFSYEWNGNDDPFEDDDEIWIKAKWFAPNGTQYWLGSSLDSQHNNGDTSAEIAAAENPDQDFSGTAIIELSDMISSAGIYYLAAGGKLRASANDEWGYVYLDDIQIQITNQTDRYYFRKHFNLASVSAAQRGFINLMSDDYARIYLNGNLIYSAQDEYDGTYWDKRGIPVDGRYFRVGDNVVAVELVNNGGSARFALELFGANQSESGAMLVMTDGQANVECAEQGVTGDLDGDGGSDDGVDDAIRAACDAREDWGIQVFAVGFSSSADELSLAGLADCGEGIYAKSDNTSILSDFYNQVVLNIISATVSSQTIILSGGASSASNLYGDSYLYYTIDPVVDEPDQNEIGVEVQSEQFNSCSPTITIPEGIRVIDAKVTSYSGEHWTKTLVVNSNVVFNLSKYNQSFITLGDPYILQAPPNIVTNGPNTFFIDTGDETSNSTSCSNNNTLIYTALVPSATSRSGVVANTDGCTWTIQFEDDTNSTKVIPSTYSEAKKCYYVESNYSLSQGSYDGNDAYDIAVFNILSALDYDHNGKVFVNLDSEDIEIVITTISSVPYMWGPALFSARIWQ